MFNEILNLYKMQLELYDEIYEKLNKFIKAKVDILAYQNELQSINKILDDFKKLNDRLEQLKIIYITKNNLADFTGKNIKKVQSHDEYEELSKIIDRLTSRIVSVKKLQDAVIKDIKNELSVTQKLINEINNKKNSGNIYSKSEISGNSTYIDRKK
jgi:division protein CdvB (Snf7/Vps24/ESCRT-III family)